MDLIDKATHCSFDREAQDTTAQRSLVHTPIYQNPVPTKALKHSMTASFESSIPIRQIYVESRYIHAKYGGPDIEYHRRPISFGESRLQRLRLYLTQCRWVLVSSALYSAVDFAPVIRAITRRWNFNHLLVIQLSFVI